MTRYAFFDFDGTLIKGDSFGLFARHAVGRGAFVKALLKSAPKIIAWKLGRASNSQAKETLFGHLYRGMRYDEFKRLGVTFAEKIRRRLRPEVMESLRRHLAAGDTVAIVTASMAEWIAPWATEAGVTTLLTTAPEVDGSGRLTGRFSGTNCHGAEKANRIREHFGAMDGCEIDAYGDSSGDDAMLALATKPHKV